MVLYYIRLHAVREDRAIIMEVVLTFRSISSFPCRSSLHFRDVVSVRFHKFVTSNNKLLFVSVRHIHACSSPFVIHSIEKAVLLFIILARTLGAVFLTSCSSRKLTLLRAQTIMLLANRCTGQSNLNVHSDKRGRPTKPPG